MSERPIIFSGPMVKAILDGSKTMTRRVCKHEVYCGPDPIEDVNLNGRLRFLAMCKCPYGKPGDRLWVREAHCFTVDDVSFDQPWDGAMERNFREKGVAHAEKHGWIIYRATDPDPDLDSDSPEWRPSIHMPRWASRITLEVVSVKVERLQDISAEDIAAEGVASLIETTASKYEVFDGYWIDNRGNDDGSEYCMECAEKTVKELGAGSDPDEVEIRICTMQGGNEDSAPFCETCGAALSYWPTDHMCEAEVDHFDENGFDILSPSDCFSLDRILGHGVDSDPEARVLRIAFQSLWDSINGKRDGCSWADSPWVWAVSFKLCDLSGQNEATQPGASGTQGARL